MAVLKVALFLFALLATGQAIREAICSTGLNACYLTYQGADKITSEGSCTPYKTLRNCVTLLTGPGTCTETEVANHADIRNAYAANVLCNDSSMPMVSILCLVIAAVIALLFRG